MFNIACQIFLMFIAALMVGYVIFRIVQLATHWDAMGVMFDVEPPVNFDSPLCKVCEKGPCDLVSDPRHMGVQMWWCPACEIAFSTSGQKKCRTCLLGGKCDKESSK